MVNLPCSRRNEITAMRYHFISNRLTKIEKFDNMLCWQGCGKQALLFIASGRANWYNLLKVIWQYLSKLKMYIPFNPAIPFLGTYHTNILACVQINVWMQLFIAVLFIIIVNWK